MHHIPALLALFLGMLVCTGFAAEEEIGSEWETAEMSLEIDQRGLADDKIVDSQGFGWATPEVDQGLIKRLVSWQNAYPSFRVPSNAIKGGFDQRHNQYYYICKAYFKNGFHPGKFFRTSRGYVCHIPWGGKENLVNNFKVLVNKCSSNSVSWVDGWKNFNLPARTVVGGYERNYSLYICRGYRDNAQNPGKLFGGRGNWGCRYSWGGKEYVATNFQVLVDHCVRRG